MNTSHCLERLKILKNFSNNDYFTSRHIPKKIQDSIKKKAGKAESLSGLKSQVYLNRKSDQKR
jgi:hypothetical protein